MIVQDDSRENLLRELFGLKKSIQENERIGPDANDEFSLEYEIKSTTVKSISASRAVQLHHFEKWRRRIWICAAGEQISKNNFKIEEIRILFPEDLEPWFCKEEQKIKDDIELMAQILSYAPDELKNHKRAKLLCSRAARPSGALSFTWSYAQRHGTIIEKDYPQTLKSLVLERRPYLKDIDREN